MRITLNIDDELLQTAEKDTGITKKPELLRAGLRALIARENARRLIRLGGTAPNLQEIPRRRMEPA
ncbi:MAG: type II toxin-antitoxin system VapB family antitoxin [Gammaproteobacteria bacterium]